MSEELESFRKEARAWLEVNCPPSMRQPYTSEAEYIWGGRKAQFDPPEQEPWLQNMAQKGWTAPDWPIAYGGAGLGREERRILREEMSRLGCRPPLHSFGISMLAPALMKFGSEEQRLEHLPAMARGEIRWCQGYSEPGAGSDLASLRTSAIAEGEFYRVNGSKIWTSHADKSDAIFCLVRTSDAGDKREGISFLLIDMETEGISVRPIRLISGASPFCQVFFDNVLVPARNRVGREGEGWKIAKYLLAHERSMISGVGGKAGTSNDLAERALRCVGEVDGKVRDPALRSEIARYDIDALSFRYAKELMRSGAQGQDMGAMSSALKYYGTELNKRRRELAVDIEGSAALMLQGDDQARAFTSTAAEWLRSKANSIEGGTSEIQLNIIARRILDLP